MKEFKRYLISNFKGIPTFRRAFLNSNEEVEYDIQLIPNKYSDDGK